MKIISEDIQDTAGSLQVCAGHISCCKAAIHAMRQVFQSQEIDRMILVDASNAFNALNQKVALQNIKNLCPSLAKVLINTYREDGQLFIDGNMVNYSLMLSQEDTIQGDPLAMAMFAISPLLHRLEEEDIKQVWFADDATAGGDISHFKSWWDCITELGPHYGYHSNASKTCLLVKESRLGESCTIFKEQ